MSALDVTALTDSELGDLIDRASTEREVRARIANAPSQVEQIVASVAVLGVDAATIRAAVEAGITQAGAAT